jgi:hypothetical protein
LIGAVTTTSKHAAVLGQFNGLPGKSADSSKICSADGSVGGDGRDSIHSPPLEEAADAGKLF